GAKRQGARAPDQIRHSVSAAGCRDRRSARGRRAARSGACGSQEIGPAMDSPTSARRILIPVTLVAVTLLVGTLQQTFTVLATRSDLLGALGRQEQSYDQAVNFRTQLSNLAADTVKLANDGDPAAKAVTEALRRQGVALPEAKPK